MENATRPHIDKTQKSLAMLAIMRRIEEKRKQKGRRRTATATADRARVAVEDLTLTP